MSGLALWAPTIVSAVIGIFSAGLLVGKLRAHDTRLDEHGKRLDGHDERLNETERGLAHFEGAKGYRHP